MATAWLLLETLSYLFIFAPLLVKFSSNPIFVIVPTLEETEGIPILEALTARIPALIHDIPIFSFLEDGVNVYKASDIEEYKKKIKGILNGELKNVTDEGYKKVQDKEIKKVGKQLVEVYKKLLEDK